MPHCFEYASYLILTHTSLVDDRKHFRHWLEYVEQHTITNTIIDQILYGVTSPIWFALKKWK